MEKIHVRSSTNLLWNSLSQKHKFEGSHIQSHKIKKIELGEFILPHCKPVLVVFRFSLIPSFCFCTIVIRHLRYIFSGTQGLKRFTPKYFRNIYVNDK